MERSSPLAAIQPPALPFNQWGYSRDPLGSCSSFEGQWAGRFNIGANTFNFKDMSMSQGPTDYFNLKPVRGSSPTASLAADLSSNFHIDQSPQLPTPRRSLFSSNYLSPINRGALTTPPPPSSSPGPGNDSMDISPLPHKAPFVVMTALEIPSSAPSTMSDVPSLTPSSIDGSSTPADETYKQALPQERRRPSLLRPSLSRTKGHSTTSVSLGSTKDSQSLLFKFGNGSLTQQPPLMPLDECFTASPPQEKRPQSAASPAPIPMGPPRFRQPSFGGSGHTRTSSSLITGHVRKPSGSTQRPRKQIRRSLSMFEHPADVMKQEKPRSCTTGDLDAIMDIDEPPQLQLPHETVEEDSLPRITRETLVEVLDGKYNHCYDQSIIIDCRFEYEFQGGHIDGAINVNDKDALSAKLFDENLSENALLIFHCEYSAKRAPAMAKFLRQQDRAKNAHQYPRLTFPEVYILTGGYKSFFEDNRFRCYPQAYVQMEAEEHANACERGLGRMKQQRTKLSRAKTFAFGQQNQSVDDSPTAMGRQCSTQIHSIEMSIDLDLRPLQSRRMFSY